MKIVKSIYEKDNDMKVFKSKTMLFSFALTALGFIQQSGAIDLIPSNYQGVVISAIGLAVAGLRLVTKTSISEK